METKQMFKLGQEVKDKITGFSGIVEVISIWMNGCVRVGVKPRKLNKDGQPQDLVTFDQEQLTLVGKGVSIEEKRTGGPKPSPVQRPSVKR